LERLVGISKGGWKRSFFCESILSGHIIQGVLSILLIASSSSTFFKLKNLVGGIVGWTGGSRGGVKDVSGVAGGVGVVVRIVPLISNFNQLLHKSHFYHHYRMNSNPVTS